ncbi:MAG: hypothetical protein CSA97_02660 [Bacteroidetes bacterium]|nr:MAG: hypothetical protein CSA97_02660 [Bacteroidota bacterium]
MKYSPIAIGLIIFGMLISSCATNRSITATNSPYADIYYTSNRAKQDSARAHEARIAREKARHEEQQRREKERLEEEKARSQQKNTQQKDELLEPKDFDSYAEYREYMDTHGGEQAAASEHSSAETRPSGHVEQRPIDSSNGSLQGASSSKTVVNNYYINEPPYAPGYVPPSYSTTRLLMSLEPGFCVRWDIEEAIYYRPRPRYYWGHAPRWVYYPPRPRVYYPVYYPEPYDPWYDPYYYDGYYEPYPYYHREPIYHPVYHPVYRKPTYRSRQPRMNHRTTRRPSTSNGGHGGAVRHTRGGSTTHQGGAVRQRRPSTRGGHSSSGDYIPVRERGGSTTQPSETVRTRRPTQRSGSSSGDYIPVRRRGGSSGRVRTGRGVPQDTIANPEYTRKRRSSSAPVRRR